MRDSTIKFTREQQAAIDHRGGSLLVSAAAGSGKTKVLVERLLSHINDGHNIDEFLVITYTRSAAYELRERIHEELLSRLAESPGNVRLRRQVLLCRGASIDTIHTFCSDILRESAHLVKLPPDFRVADESESLLIMNAVVDLLLSKSYENLDDNIGFSSLLDVVAEGRDDKRLIEVIIDIHKKLQSTLDPRAWLEDQIEKQKTDGIRDVAETEAGKYLLKRLSGLVEYCLNEMLDLKDKMKQYPIFEDKYSQSINVTIQQISALLKSFDAGWDTAGQNRNIEFPRPKPVKGYEEFKSIRSNCQKELKKCSAELEISSSEHIKDMNAVSVAITALLRLLLEFDSVYSEEKRRRGVVDFSDLEHLTLSLLVDISSGKKTELTKNISGRYREILVDEYQDVNAVQEYIFSALSNNSSNVFMVGDVKQSIYRFRLADPSIFLSKYNKYTEFDFDNETNECTYGGLKIHLSQNFRSGDGIIEAVNQVFKRIMSTGFGDIEYSVREELIAGRAGAKGKQGKKGKPYSDRSINSSVEMDVLCMSDFDTEPDEDSPNLLKIEADHLADRIEELMNSSYCIPDGENEKRGIKYSDIVILLRSMKGRAWQYAASLTEKGIPVEFQGSEGFFDTFEITCALSLLAVIDNPLQDIPLAAVLNGPVYSFSADDLAEIRTNSFKESMYDALKLSAEHEIESCETSLKCRKVLSDIEELRSVMADMSADRFIWHVFNKTGLLGLVSAMKNGEKRRNNLIILAEIAQKIEKNGYKGLFGFLTYIRDLREKGFEISGGKNSLISSSGATDSVKIMSIHQSKGLEFPVVILANTSKLFNYKDSIKSSVFHTDLGLGMMLIDRKRRVKYTTLARSAIQLKLNDEMLSEELRVLYVAMTRAREKLIISSIFKNSTRIFEKIDLLPPGKLVPQAMKSLRCTAEWIIAGARYDTYDGEAAAAGTGSNAIQINRIDASTCRVKLPETQPGVVENRELQNPEAKTEGKIVLQNLPVDFSFKYPYESAIDLPSKLTVTGLSALSDPEAERASWTRSISDEEKIFAAPSFTSEKRKKTAAEHGILLHHIMQHIDYETVSAEPDIKSVDKALQLLVSSGYITHEETLEVNKKKIMKLFDSELGGRMISGKNQQKEFKFSILRPAKEYFPCDGDEEILLQGIIDCFFEEDDEIVIVDFKTDKVSKATINEKAQLYTPQLDAYAAALHLITGKRIKERIIYFFSVDSAFYL